MRRQSWVTVLLALFAVGRACAADPPCCEPRPASGLGATSPYPACCRCGRLAPAGGWHPYGGGLLCWWPRHCFPCAGGPDDYCRKPLPRVCWSLAGSTQLCSSNRHFQRGPSPEVRAQHITTQPITAKMIAGSGTVVPLPLPPLTAVCNQLDGSSEMSKPLTRPSPLASAGSPWPVRSQYPETGEISRPLFAGSLPSNDDNITPASAFDEAPRWTRIDPLIKPSSHWDILPPRSYAP
jgi:hypothetical protein